MAVLLDTGFYFALLSIKDENHTRAHQIFTDLVEGAYGRIFTTDFVLDEALTLLNVRTHGKRKDLMAKMRGLFLGSEPIAFLISVERSWLDEIAVVQEKMTGENRPVSYTDAANIVACQKLKIPQIVSFDGHYEGHLQVIK